MREVVGGEEGRWSQDVVFSSTFELCGSPSFDMGILEMHVRPPSPPSFFDALY